MRLKQNRLSHIVVVLILSTMVSAAIAEEKIIQQEQVSFQKCLKVITTSQDKLSLAPNITDESDNKRIAVFELVDGTLTITCDRDQNLLTVSTKMN